MASWVAIFFLDDCELPLHWLKQPAGRGAKSVNVLKLFRRCTGWPVRLTSLHSSRPVHAASTFGWSKRDPHKAGTAASPYGVATVDSVPRIESHSRPRPRGYVQKSRAGLPLIAVESRNDNFRRLQPCVPSCGAGGLESAAGGDTRRPAPDLHKNTVDQG